MKSIDQYRGCLIGGAVGDALGYAVEFMMDSAIFQKYGERGITEYTLCDSVALISDDTQMTLFTANGILYDQWRTGTTPLAAIAQCYCDWYQTQTDGKKATAAWLNNLPELNARRAPGNTCMSALHGGLYRLGSIDEPINLSKGCGGVMRVAPIGLMDETPGMSLDQIDLLGAQATALTHGHELGYIPSAMLVHIVHLLTHRPDMTIRAAVEDAKSATARLFPDAHHLPRMLQLTDSALHLADKPHIKDLDAIRTLGEGWVGEEALAIAIYCAAKYENEFEKAIIASVNHSGDSDSTGAVTGNILGAHLGLKAIPEKFLTSLELRDTIIDVADDLFYGKPKKGDPRYAVWERKYGHHTYPNA